MSSALFIPLLLRGTYSSGPLETRDSIRPLSLKYNICGAVRSVLLNFALEKPTENKVTCP